VLDETGLGEVAHTPCVPSLAEQLGDATALARAALTYCGPHRFEAAVAVIGPSPTCCNERSPRSATTTALCGRE
jgi:hypothetical protein